VLFATPSDGDVHNLTVSVYILHELNTLSIMNEITRWSGLTPYFNSCFPEIPLLLLVLNTQCKIKQTGYVSNQKM